MLKPTTKNAFAALAIGTLLVGIFSALVIWFRSDLREEIHLKIIERDAAVLYPMALQQIADSEPPANNASSFAPLYELLKSSRQRGMLAVAIFDREGNALASLPATQVFVELPPRDYLQLLQGEPISRYHPAFPLDQYFTNISSDQRSAPVLEVLLPLPGRRDSGLLGFSRYFIDARALAHELAIIDQGVDRQTLITLGVGAILIALVMTLAVVIVQRTQRLLAERNAGLARANFQLTLAAKASAIGQITSHLMHGLQGSVEGLRAVVRGPDADQSNPAWESAANYTERLQTMIRETVALLGDTSAHATYELNGHELVATIREQNRSAANEKGVILEVSGGFSIPIDSHRGSLLCLIASNLIQNAIMATARGRQVTATIEESNRVITLIVRDEGTGVPESLREHLFQPGRSSRSGGSGLGLAISQLLARQIGAVLTLEETGPKGSHFQLVLPLPVA